MKLKTLKNNKTAWSGVIPALMGVVFALTSTIGSAADPGVIDLFTTNQALVEDTTPEDEDMDGGVFGSAGTAVDTSILGGERDVFVVLESRTEDLETLGISTGVADGQLVVSLDAGVTGYAIFQWDGVDGSIDVDPTGLGGVDITAGGLAAAFELAIKFADFGFDYEVTAWTNATHWTRVSYTQGSYIPPGSGPDVPDLLVQLQFSDFSNCVANSCGTDGPVNLAELGALEFKIQGVPSFDMILTSITTTVPDTASLGDRVWNDKDADGTQDCTTPTGPKIGDGDDDCDEPGIPGVTVNLLSPGADGDCNTVDDGLLDSTTTDADGFYLFSNLNPGSYCVEFDKDSADTVLGCTDFIGGVQSSPQNVGNNAQDSDADPDTGRTGNIDLLAGALDRTNDAGFYCPAKIGDMLVDDVDGDGIQGPLEEGVPNQEVKLVKCVGGVPGTEVIDSQDTDGTGMYMFNPLPPGEYAVIFSKPDDTVFSDPNVGDDETVDCDTDPNGVSECVTLAPNEYNQDVDACVVIPPAGLGDFVWEDRNVDGVQDNNEPGIEDLTVNLLLPGDDGNCNTGDDVFAGTTTTGASGEYEFIGLNPGTYCVEFKIDSLPDNFCTTDGFALGAPKFTLQNQGADDADSDADPTTGVTGNIDLGPLDFDPKNDAGIYCPAKIGDRVWEDSNSDGIQDGSEDGLENVEVQLFECGPDGVAGTIDDVDTGERRYTDNIDGNYMFGAEPGVFDLAPGNYYVKFIKPGGREFTAPEQGGNAELDSDCRGADGVSSCISVGSRDIDLSRDCGLIPPPPPQCDLVLDKTCLVETPPPPSFDKCEGKLQEFTLVWTGGNITVNGLGKTDEAVATNDVVTFDGPFGGDNDVFIDITGAVSGQSKFHLSCSDEDFNSPDDCGKFAGDGKKDGDGFINMWKLQGFVDKEGQVLDCGDGQTADFPTQDSCTFMPQAANCEVLDKPASLTFRYTGQGCGASDNAQGDDSECTGDVNGLQAVSIVAGRKGADDADEFYIVEPTSVAPGELFTISKEKSDGSKDNLDSNSEIQITNSGGTETNIFHTSCSQPLEVGDVYGSLELVGFNGVGGGVDVLYGYEVTNNGDPLSNVTIVDNLLGPVAGPLSLGKGATQRFTLSATVAETTTNVAKVTGTLPSPGGECVASDEVTVEVEEPPQPPLSCSDIKDITALSMVWDGPSGVDIVTETGQLFSNVQKGNQINFDANKDVTGNDVDLTISGAVSGSSKFHISCSDDAMNGSEDCGTNQGNGKSDESGLINLFLLDGMTGEGGAFECGLPNTGVVDPEVGGGTGGNVSGASSLDLDDKKVKWELTNNGSQDVFITRVEVTWPSEHEQVKKFKLDGDFAKDVFDASSPTVVPDDKAFESDPKKRILKAGDSDELEIEFTEEYKDNVQSDYTITVEFDNGQVLSFP